MAVVTAPCGRLVGIDRPDSFAFLGIPYAQAPIGELRFAAPSPRPRFTEAFDATAYGATPQRRKIYAETFIPEPSIPGDEILNLNVFTPTLDAESALPVHVYIHGGGYISGSHVGSWFDGARFNRHDIIVVTIAYRLGFDGFGWIEDAPRNRGLLDMIAALTWVQENISAFGGDPKRVTISGQSAGGGAVLALMAMPQAQGLFHRVISHSHVIGAATPQQHEQRGRAFADACGVEPTVAGWKSLTEDQVVTRQFELLRFDEPIHPVGTMLRWLDGALCEVVMQWGPAVDPDTFPMAPYEALPALSQHVPLLIGSTSEEFVMDVQSDPDEVRAWADGIVLSAQQREHLERLIRQGKSDPLGFLSTAFFFRKPVLDVAAVRNAGNTWLYDFIHKGDIEGNAHHCLELPFVWDCLNDPHARAVAGANEPQALADEMHSSWVSFIRGEGPGWAAGTCRVFGADHGWRPYQDVEALVPVLPPRG